MGQRSQIIVLEQDQYTKKVRCTAIYHNQWSYGVGFLNNLHDLLTVYSNTLKKIKKGAKKAYEQDRKMGVLKWHLVDYINLKDFPQTKGYSKNEFDPDKINKIEDAFEYCDNNNGYIILYFKGEKLLYDIISGTEDTGTEKRISPDKYLELFYSNDWDLKNAKFTKSNIKAIKLMVKELNEFDRFNSRRLAIQ